MEEYEAQGSEAIDLERYLNLVRRRHLLFLIPLFIGWILVWAASWVLPARYKSGTLILVEQPTMPKNYVVPNINDDLQARLQSITEQILSRTRLLLIINKLGLYNNPSSHRLRTPDEKVALMQKDIDIELVKSTQGDQITAFKVYYSAHDPQVAQKVTSELTNLFISDNLKVRQQQSEDTTRFLSRQLETASANLADQEVRVREFKGHHEGELPSQEASNLQILSGLQQQLQNEQDTLNTAKQQRVYLQTLIDQYRTMHSPNRSVDGVPTASSAIDDQLATLRAKLADLSSRYTDHYPEVENLKDEIAQTEKIRNTLFAESKTKGTGGKHVDDTSIEAVGSAQSAASLQLQSQLQANQIEITNREQAIADLKARVSSYQDRLNSAPAREQELADLTRGYDQSKANYDDLLKKKNESEMATSMEQMQEGQRFTMLDPPSLPLKPDFPNRLKFCGLGLAVGVVFGFVIVGTCEFMDDCLYGEKEIKVLLPVAIIAEIPEVVGPSEERKRKNKMVLGWTMAVTIAAIILAGSAFSYLHG